MNENARKKKVGRIKDIADSLSAKGLNRLWLTAEAECQEDDDCKSGNPGPGEPPPDPPPNP